MGRQWETPQRQAAADRQDNGHHKKGRPTGHDAGHSQCKPTAGGGSFPLGQAGRRRNSRMYGAVLPQMRRDMQPNHVLVLASRAFIMSWWLIGLGDV